MTHRPQLNGNKTMQDFETKLSIKELELTSLLEVTRAINANLPESALYKIFHFTLIANLRIPKLALFVEDNEWSCKVNFNTKSDYRSSVFISEYFNSGGISLLGNVKGYEEFDIVVPIAHKSKVLAYVLVGGIEFPEEYLNSSNISFIQTFASIIIVAIENKKLVRKELHQEAFKKEMEIARDVQSMLFPKELPSNEKVKMFATYLPHQSIGGDYYDYIFVDKDQYIVCIGDVSGKGVPAALLMSNFQACLRTLARQTNDLKQIVEELNYSIIANAKGEKFITFFIASIHLADKTIKYINAGHNPSFLVSANGDVKMLEKGTTVLGAFQKLPFLEEDLLPFTPGSLLFNYTDGLTETVNNNNEEFGQEGVKQFLASHKKGDLHALHLALKTKLDTYREDKNYADDITYLSCMLS